jgi:hypothetical protein
VLIKVELSGTGEGCKVQVRSDSNEDLSQAFVNTILDMIEKKHR